MDRLSTLQEFPASRVFTILYNIKPFNINCKVHFLAPTLTGVCNFSTGIFNIETTGAGSLLTLLQSNEAGTKMCYCKAVTTVSMNPSLCNFPVIYALIDPFCPTLPVGYLPTVTSEGEGQQIEEIRNYFTGDYI